MTFLIDDEDALCRMLAARTWTSEYMSQSDKELQERMRKQNAEATTSKLCGMLDDIKKNKCKTGQENPATRKKMLEDKFTETVVAEIKVS